MQISFLIPLSQVFPNPSPMQPYFDIYCTLNTFIYKFYGKSESFCFFSNKALYRDRKQLVVGLYFWRMRLVEGRVWREIAFCNVR